ncbi:hypothetical protein HYDPIDRAFT_44860, partial [Hydnomerulius pinastri MD-312]
MNLPPFYPPPSDVAKDDDSLEALLGDSVEDTTTRREAAIHHRKSQRHLSLAIHALLILVATTFFALWIRSLPPKTCPLDPLLTYSPVNEAVEYVNVHFNGSVQSTSIFRGDPSPEIDAAWRRVSTDVKATRLTRSQFLLSGGNDSTSAIKFRPEDGGGYMSQIDGYHHVHCL